MEINEGRVGNEGAADYREKIIDMVSQIDNLGTLEYIHKFIELFLEKWG